MYIYTYIYIYTYVTTDIYVTTDTYVYTQNESLVSEPRTGKQPSRSGILHEMQTLDTDPIAKHGYTKWKVEALMGEEVVASISNQG